MAIMAATKARCDLYTSRCREPIVAFLEHRSVVIIGNWPTGRTYGVCQSHLTQIKDDYMWREFRLIPMVTPQDLTGRCWTPNIRAGCIGELVMTLVVACRCGYAAQVELCEEHAIGWNRQTMHVCRTRRNCNPFTFSEPIFKYPKKAESYERDPQPYYAVMA